MEAADRSPKPRPPEHLDAASQRALRLTEAVAGLHEISAAVQRSTRLEDIVRPVLETMAGRLQLVRPAIGLLDRETGEIAIEAAAGLSDDQRRRGRYRLGEGVTGRVVQGGEPLVVPRWTEDPQFLNRTGARAPAGDDDLSFICVPIRLGEQVLGCLSADRHHPSATSAGSRRSRLEHDQHLLSVIAAMMAHAVRAHELARRSRRRLDQSVADPLRPANIIGRSKGMLAVYEMIAQVCRSEATVLIRGESGVGKELVAEAIHAHSPRVAKPLVKVNCAALPATVLESELFGHEKGAFTGAVAQRKGRFELADGGTIFLDEIGDLPAATQIMLLRILQEKEFERVGGTQTHRSDVRVIAATNRDLERLMSDETFRADLYYRLNVFPIHVPPLRERRTDVLLLADFFVERYGRANGKNVRRISTPAIDMLMSYHWPGNVRELENCIERAVLLSNDEVIHGHHLPPSLQTAEASGTPCAGTLQAAIDAVEREMIVEQVKLCRGNTARAARALGLTERVMGLRLRKHAIDHRRFRPSRREQ